MSIEAIIYYSVLILVCICFVVASFQKGIRHLNYLSFYLIVTVIIDFGLELRKILLSNIENNVIIYKFYFLFSINLFAFFYSFVFRNKRRIILAAITLLLNLGLISTIDFKSQAFEYQLSIAFPVFYVFLALMWFQYKLTQDIEKKITQEPYFWVSSGLLIWGGFFLFRVIPAEYLFENDPQFYDTLKKFNFIISTIMYLLFFVALLKFKKQEER